ncbi:putative protein EXORDIUM [Helianthus annuus]|nr:putative protein EXORDIUM [Helianthus annuus]KAJ0730027.1 putative protein EXORDIUM [Helianthus annuus]
MRHFSGDTRLSPAKPTIILILLLFLFSRLSTAWRPWPNQKNNVTEHEFGANKKYEGSSEFVKMKYHMGPVLTSNITVHIIWYSHNKQIMFLRILINVLNTGMNRSVIY